MSVYPYVVDLTNSELAAYNKGRDAYYSTHAIARADNPYPVGTVENAAWDDGYMDAFSEDAN